MLTRVVCFIMCVLMLASCGRIKHKWAQMVDKVIPTFDSYKADSEFNKKRFSQFIQVERTADIKNIYCYADEIGIDALYQFSFNCAPLTAQTIINKHKLVADTTNQPPQFQREFSWWNIQQLNAMPHYIHNHHDTYFQYFWYDSATQQAWYLDYDI